MLVDVTVFFCFCFCRCCLWPAEMGTDLPGPVAMPGAVVGAGQVRMAGSMPGRGGKRRSGG